MTTRVPSLWSTSSVNVALPQQKVAARWLHVALAHASANSGNMHRIDTDDAQRWLTVGVV